MSTYISTTIPGENGEKGKYVGTRVGTNGAADPLIALLLAGYAVGGFPESARVRARWLGEAQITPVGMYPIRWPSSVLGIDRHTVAGLRAVIGYHDEGMSWLKLERDTIERGLKLKPATCPILRGILHLLPMLRGQGQGYDGWLATEVVPEIAAAIHAVIPHLEASSAQIGWYETILEVVSIFMEAAEHGVRVHAW